MLGKIGFALTVIYLTAILILQWDKIIDVQKLNLNEFGDFLAGLFGPVAIFWLVLGFFQQGKELKNSVAALNLQAEELKRSVEQQTSMVEVASAQYRLDQSAAEAEAAAKLAAADPLFQLRTAGRSGGNPPTYRLKLFNHGAEVVKFRGSIVTVDGQRVAHRELVMFKNADEVEYSVSKNFADGDVFRCLVEYRTKLGADTSVNAQLTWHETSNDFLISEFTLTS